jgi:hypothetical protein
VNPRRKTSKKDVIIPYRDSKLTRLLQNALGGSSKTIMICAISPASTHSEETLSTLRWADRAKKIQNVARVNENPQDKLVREMKEENEKLKEMMSTLTLGGAVDVVALKEKQLELARAEEALQEMQRSWEDKLKDAQERAEREQELTRRRVTRSVMSLQRGCPHIVNLSSEKFLSGKLKFCFEEGVTRIGQPSGEGEDSDSSESSSSSDESDGGRQDGSWEFRTEANVDQEVVLMGDGIRRKHAIVTNIDNRCIIRSKGLAAQTTFINGYSVAGLLLAAEAGTLDELDEVRFLAKAETSRRGGNSPGRPVKSEHPTEVEDQGVVLRHGDRIIFSKAVFFYVEPHEGFAEMMILSGEVSYAQARQEKQQRYVADASLMMPDMVSDDTEPSSDDGGQSRSMEVGLLRKDSRRGTTEGGDGAVGVQEARIAQLEKELGDVREELAWARAELAKVIGLSAGSSARWQASELKTQLERIFDSAVDALDDLQSGVISPTL